MTRKLFAGLFFLSGFTALIYQILWTREFSFVLGNTYLTISVIVSSFMAGLFAGAALIGKLLARDAIRNELRFFAAAEMTIGLFGVFSHYLIAAQAPVLKVLYDHLQSAPLAHDAARALLILVLLFIPTAAMGATLPLVVRYFTRSKSMFGENISLFYGVNTVGGALGAVLAGFYLIEHIGVRHGLLLAALINFLVAATVFFYARRQEPAGVVAAEKDAGRKQKNDSRWILPGKSLILIAAALSGFASLAYEIIWSRGLKFLIHNSTYSFSVILFMFLLGIAIGSGISKRLLRRERNAGHLFGSLQLVIGLYAVFSLYLLYGFSYSEFFQKNVVNLIYDYAYGWEWGLVVYCLVCAVIFLVPTVTMGMTFPLLNQMYFECTGAHSGQTVSRIYAINTAGSILGSLLAGFLLLPVWGIKTSILIVAAFNLALGAVFVLRCSQKPVRTFVPALLLGIVAVWSSLQGNYLYGRGEKAADKVLFYREGLMSTVKVFERRRNRYMSVDGNIIASTEQTLFRKEKLIAHLPFMLRPDLKEVLAVGLASGVSTGSMTLQDSVRNIDCVELIKPVFPAAHYFDDANQRIFENPAVHLHNDDIFGFLLHNEKKYDLISSDGKLGTLYSGNTIMLSLDFYEACKQRLKKDGLFIQWNPIITPKSELEIILKTMRETFPHVSVFYFYPSDVYLVASEIPIVLDADKMKRTLSNPRIARDLASVRIAGAEAFLTAFLGEWTPDFADEIPVNTFDRPLLEFRFMRDWKKSQLYAGGYRARNLEYLLQSNANLGEGIREQVAGVDDSGMKNLNTVRTLFFQGCIKYFKTRQYRASFRDYLLFRNTLAGNGQP